MNELTLNTMSNTIDKYIVITFSIVNNPYRCHPYMFLTQNDSAKFTIMSFGSPSSKFPTKNGIPKQYLDTSLKRLTFSIQDSFEFRLRENLGLSFVTSFSKNMKAKG